MTIMAKKWSEKLQCPVDEDADYGNTYVRSFEDIDDQISLMWKISGATAT